MAIKWNLSASFRGKQFDEFRFIGVKIRRMAGITKSGDELHWRLKADRRGDGKVGLRSGPISRGETKTAAVWLPQFRFVEQVLEISNEFILGFKAVIEFKS